MQRATGLGMEWGCRVHDVQIMQSLMGCEEELGFDITTLNALAVTVTIVTTIFQMKKIRLREVYSLIQQTFIEHLLRVRLYWVLEK